MSSTSSPPAKLKKRKGATKPPTSRSLSASEIAKNLTNFEIWSSYNKCEQVSYSDIPADFRDDVEKVFDCSSKPKLPASWVDAEDCDSSPRLFSNMVIVHSAWRRLKMMKQSKEKYSEADYAANVYNVFRSPAIRESTHRVQCSISLPQPIVTTNLGPETYPHIGHKDSHPNVVKTGNVSKCSSFRFQSTPLVVPPETAAFQFCSSFWEDKKPVHQMLEDAYRQNRMATTASARHLHSHHVKAPVFGLVWASGTVRAHVDWCSAAEEKSKHPVVYSAPYRIEDRGDGADIFHEWQVRTFPLISGFRLTCNPAGQGRRHC
ncbi:hypothetical protein B0H14DRAFT_2672638 [Mycena olivaceomarginata]|nr:hypothetical protein B0H14DRAFT_2672638 [Mycena olivaceomarginata]